jgi:plastocyanin
VIRSAPEVSQPERNELRRRTVGRGDEDRKEFVMKDSKTTQRWPWRAAIVAGLTLAALLAAQHASASSSVAVGIKEFAFAPAALTVPVGTTVTWTNHDEEPHTVTSATGAFRSAGLSNEETFAQTFTRPGTYQYFCALHPHMNATVIVK